jgi:hypothetical protein
MVSKGNPDFWLRLPDLLLFGTALTFGGFLGGSKLGFWWTVIDAVITAFVLAGLASLVSMRRASAYLRAQGVPGEAQHLVLRLGFLPRFGGTITTILVVAGIVALFT